MSKLKDICNKIKNRFKFTYYLIRAGEFIAIFKRIKGLIFKKKKIIYDTSLRRKKKYDVSRFGKIAVYTCVTGGYDKVFSPCMVELCCDYFLFTDDINIQYDKKIWKLIDVSEMKKRMSSLEIARFIKTHPHIYFQDYSQSVWIDGNLQIQEDIESLGCILGDDDFIAINRHPTKECCYDEAIDVIALNKANPKQLKQQLKSYKKEGFPINYGQFETNVIIRKHMDIRCIKIMEDWWNEIEKWTKRDQMSFTYTLWKNGYSCDVVCTLGNGAKKDKRFTFRDH